ncbi:uncharacterized protein MONOS_9604 [Monocercomonoides exilis]|uniref:uncharacterized protein n=1 Tax=Monocercomonoides exilis TaxID=2049356 RepID=UPI0035593A57|nr:hypothetical protein MONOS_9604 [Monocercomonoides exilis]
MEQFIDGRTEDGDREMAPKEKFSKLLDELKSCSVSEQKEKIEEMNRLFDEMNTEELEHVYTIDMFNKIDQMIKEEKLTMGNAILLLKHIGYYKILKCICRENFFCSSLSRRFREMIIKEDKKKEGNNEKLFINLIECYLLLDNRLSSDLYPICVPCLLKVALKKEEDEKTQKEVEMVLLALTNVGYIPEEMYLNEIKEIIQHHQEHHNLTHLSYHCAWEYLINRLPKNSLEEEMVNELHFAREATKELEELSESVDWKKKEEEMRKTERKTMDIILRWIDSICYYLYSCHLWNEEYAGLISRIVDVLRASRDNHSEICKEYILLFYAITKNRAVKLDVLLKSGAIDAALEEILRPTLNRRMTLEFIFFFSFDFNAVERKGG